MSHPTQPAPWRPWLEVPGLLLAALGCAWVSNALAGPARHLSWGTPLRPAQAPAPARPAEPSPELRQRFPASPEQPQTDITGDEATWLWQRGALVLDARRAEAYRQGHLPGARQVSVWEDGAEAKIEELAAFAADLKDPVVLYCAGGGCEDSHLLARKLLGAGFRNLRIYAGGFPDWTARAQPITAGDTP